MRLSIGGNIMLEESKHVHYCKKCKAMLILWDEEIAELYTQNTYFAHDGILEAGNAEFLSTITGSKHNKIVCRNCRDDVKHYVLIEKEVFLQILKYSYRDENHPDNIFKINLKSRKGQKSMEPPTLREIKDAMVEELI